MPEAFPAIIAGLYLVLLELVRSIPALRRVQSTKNSDGISGSSLGVLAGTGMAWIFLAFLIQSWWVFAANGIWLIIHVLLCKEVAKIDSAKRTQIITTSAISAAVLGVAGVIAYFSGTLVPVLNVAVSLAAIFYAVPALYEGMRSKTTQGLSLVALGVNTLEGMVYLMAGIGIVSLSEDPGPVFGFILFGTISILSNGLRFIRVSYRRAKGLDSLHHNPVS